MQKRSQVTIFIVLGIVLIFVLLGLELLTYRYLKQIVLNYLHKDEHKDENNSAENT